MRKTLYLHNDGPVNEDSVGHVERDRDDMLIKELDEATSSLDSDRGIPENN